MGLFLRVGEEWKPGRVLELEQWHEQHHGSEARREELSGKHNIS